MAEEKAKILVVDNDPSFLYAFEFTFGDEYDVLTAADGLTARALAEEALPNLIVLDVMMPPRGFDEGFELCKELKENPTTKDIPIIIVTHRSEEDREIAEQVGANKYLTKPFNQIEFQKILVELLKQPEDA
jgi:CheY-like chemotaxis protein